MADQHEERAMNEYEICAACGEPIRRDCMTQPHDAAPSEGRLRVFQVDDVTWYAGTTGEEAVATYLRDAGEEMREYVEEFGGPVELTDEQLDRMTVTDVDEPGQPKHTFREALNQCAEPGFIATSEY